MGRQYNAVKLRRSRRCELIAAAERLFAQQGYHGATLREITAAADVPLGLATYYFGSKEALFKAVLQRREPVLTGSLDHALNALYAYNPEPGIELLMDAYVRPHVELVLADEAWRDYFQVLNQLAGFDDRNIRGAPLFDTFHAVIRRFIGAFQDHLPDVPLARIGNALVMVRMLQVSFIAESLSGKAALDMDRLPLNLLPELIRFCTAGFVAALEVHGDGDAAGHR